MTPGETLVPCVGAVVHDASGRLLLVRRRNEPGRGRWSLPGGRVEPGETDEAALAREVGEETGLTVRAKALVGTVRRKAPDGRTFDIRDYAATALGGELRAGDDATEVAFVDAATFASLPLVARLAEVLAEWDCLPRQGGTT